MIEKVGVMTFLMANLEIVGEILEDITPVIGQVIEDEYVADMQAAIDDGLMEYQELTAGIDEKWGWLVDIEWPDGVDYDQGDIIEVVPEHVYLLIPGTEIVILDIINAVDWFTNFPWSSFKNVIFKIAGTAVNGFIFGAAFPLYSSAKVPFTDKLVYKDVVTGVVQRGDLFDPPKKIIFEDLKPLMVKAFVIAGILTMLKTTGLVAKVFNAIKGGMNWRSKQMLRQALKDLDSDTALIVADIADVKGDVANLDVVMDEFSKYKPYG